MNICLLAFSRSMELRKVFLMHSLGASLAREAWIDTGVYTEVWPRLNHIKSHAHCYGKQ